MGIVPSKCYLNLKWEVEQLKKLIERKQNCNLKWLPLIIQNLEGDSNYEKNLAYSNNDCLIYA